MTESPTQGTAPSKEQPKPQETHDALGLPLWHERYARRSCKRCYGRGYQTLVKGHDTAGKEPAPRVLRRCPCSDDRYWAMHGAAKSALEQAETEQAGRVIVDVATGAPPPQETRDELLRKIVVGLGFAPPPVVLVPEPEAPAAVPPWQGDGVQVEKSGK